MDLVSNILEFFLQLIFLVAGIFILYFLMKQNSFNFYFIWILSATICTFLHLPFHVVYFQYLFNAYY